MLFLCCLFQNNYIFWRTQFYAPIMMLWRPKLEMGTYNFKILNTGTRTSLRQILKKRHSFSYFIMQLHYYLHLNYFTLLFKSSILFFWIQHLRSVSLFWIIFRLKANPSATHRLIVNSLVTNFTVHFWKSEQFRSST